MKLFLILILSSIISYAQSNLSTPTVILPDSSGSGLAQLGISVIPIIALDVRGTGSFTQLGVAQTTDYIAMFASDSFGPALYWDSTKDMRFGPASSGLYSPGGFVDVLHIQSSTGNIGIGITSPTEKLHVNGNILDNGEVFTDAVGFFKTGPTLGATIGYDNPNTCLAVTIPVLGRVWCWSMGGGNFSDWDILPTGTITRNLGGTSNRWLKLWVKDIDLSGTCTGCPSGGGLPVLDTTIITQNASDITKQLKFDNSGISTGTTRTVKWQDNNYTVAGINIAQTFTASPTFSASIFASGTPDIGSTGNYFSTVWMATAHVGGSVAFDKVGPALGASIAFDNTNIGLAIAAPITGVLWEFHSGGGNESWWDVYPNSTNSRDLGHSGNVWRNVWGQTIIGNNSSGTAFQNGANTFNVDNTGAVISASLSTNIVISTTSVITAGVNATSSFVFQGHTCSLVSTVMTCP